MEKLNFIFTGIGAFFAIFAVYYKAPQRMKYYISMLNNKLVLVLWNSSGISIAREDLEELAFIGPRNAKLEVVYSNDNIELEIGEADPFNYNNDYKKIFKTTEKLYRQDLSFDFIYPHTGYIVEIDNIPEKSHFGVFGRIKNEDRFSVNCSKEMYWDKWTKIFSIISRPMDVINQFCTIYLLVIGILMVVFSSGVFFVGGIIFVCIGIMNIINMRQNRVPYLIKKYYKKSYKDYKIIKDSNKLVYYPYFCIDKYK